MNLFDVCAFIEAPLGTGPRQANDSEVSAYLDWQRERRGLVKLPRQGLEWSGSYRRGRDERICIGATYGAQTVAAVHESGRWEGENYTPGRNTPAQWENGSYSLLMPGYAAHRETVTMETLDESGEVIASQTLPREPKKGGVIWSRDEIRKACGPVLKVAKPRKVKSAPIAEPAAAPPIEAPEIPASAGAGERVEAPDAPMGQIDASALREAPSAPAELVQETHKLPDADPIAELTARLASLESRVATLSGESIAAPTVAKRTPAHERAIRRAWAERKAARKLLAAYNRSGDDRRALSLALQEAEGRLQRATTKRRRAVLALRDAHQRADLDRRALLAGRDYADRLQTERDEARSEATATRQANGVLQASLTKLRADLADPHQPERESDLLLLKRQRDEARAEAERERNAAAAVNERNTRLQSVMADLGERFEVMAGRVARAEAALRVQGAVA